jgi:uncharacterized integral membrane protein
MNAQPEHRPRVVVRGVGFLWGFVLALPLSAALIVFIAQNTQQVTVRWAVWKVHSSLAVVVLVALIAAILIAETVGVVWRYRRRRLLAQQESLQAELAARTATTDAVAQTSEPELAHQSPGPPGDAGSDGEPAHSPDAQQRREAGPQPPEQI